MQMYLHWVQVRLGTHPWMSPWISICSYLSQSYTSGSCHEINSQSSNMSRNDILLSLWGSWERVWLFLVASHLLAKPAAVMCWDDRGIRLKHLWSLSHHLEESSLENRSISIKLYRSKKYTFIDLELRFGVNLLIMIAIAVFHSSSSSPSIFLFFKKHWLVSFL